MSAPSHSSSSKPSADPHTVGSMAKQGALDGTAFSLSTPPSSWGLRRSQNGNMPRCVSRADFSVAVYVVTDRRVRVGKTVAAVVEEALVGDGRLHRATMIQLREKDTPREQTLALGCELRELTRRLGATFVVNDSIELAAQLGADGVHLGQDDASLADARRLLGERAIVGVSAGTPDEARRAVRDGADYVGVGAVFATRTKLKPGAAIGEEGLRAVVQAVDGRVQVVAIGGVNATNAHVCMRAGADGVAVVSAVMASEQPGETTAALARVVMDEGRR